jgi:hypothetical protein
VALKKKKKPKPVNDNDYLKEAFDIKDNLGPAIVPFFPSHWQEKANEIFN